MIATLLSLLASLLNQQDTHIEGKISYYYPTNSAFRNTYQEGGPLYGVEITTKIYKDLYPWMNGGYITQPGCTPIGHYSTTIDFFPVSLGVKYFIPLFIDPYDYTAKRGSHLYFGAGILGEFLRTRKSSPEIEDLPSTWSVGWVGKSGLFIDVKHGIFIDIFIDYYYANFPFNTAKTSPTENNEITTSGLSTGLGIGYNF